MILFFLTIALVITFFFIGLAVGFIRGEQSVYKKLSDEAAQFKRINEHLNHLKQLRDQRHD